MANYSRVNPCLQPHCKGSILYDNEADGLVRTELVGRCTLCARVPANAYQDRLSAPIDRNIHDAYRNHARGKVHPYHTEEGEEWD